MADVEKKADKIEKNVDKAMNKVVDKIVNHEKGMEKEEKEQVKKEVKKRFRERVYGKTKASALKFRKEFKKQSLLAITAAFGFLVALSWREPISGGVNLIVSKLGVDDKLVYYQFLSAVIVTLIAVLVLMIVSKWNSGNK